MQKQLRKSHLKKCASVGTCVGGWGGLWVLSHVAWFGLGLGIMGFCLLFFLLEVHDSF